MPLLFIVTLFLSASLLFMVQPMVGKMVLPLLGGSPAVWNACMVFFQALLLLGYLYAHWLSTRLDPKKQLAVHVMVLMAPVAVMALAVAFGAKNTPIAIVESLAPSDETSPVLSVLALLAIAIGIPFLVASTSAPLLQKWFAFTGHPTARDPYFLYAASNAGSLISLLGYPIFLEPNLTLAQQAWLFAGGFALLVVLIVFCGGAASNPIGVPPASVKGANGAPSAAVEPPPSWPRKLKWIVLAFVPSSLMLGVTVHMTTDIASIPLLWVGPLALYLITFIIAFGRVPNWFRMVIGNLAPVMILLLVFLMISGVSPGTGVSLMLHLATFFAAALMCHYELARDRPSPQYLTEFFLLMSVGGVLGGLFNSIIAPLVFPMAYEYPLVLVIACLMVPKLTSTEEPKELTAKSVGMGATTAAVSAAASESFGGIGRLINRVVRHYIRVADRNAKVALALDFVIPIIIGVAFWQMAKLPEKAWFYKITDGIATALTLSEETVRVVLVYAVPVMVCFFFVDRPLRFALCVAAILGISTFKDEGRGTVHTERSFFGILKVQADTRVQTISTKKGVARWDDGTPVVAGEIEYHRLVHGTTLHGTQIYSQTTHFLDDFQHLTALNSWDNLVTAVALARFNPREEPLTYYHRTGPVGAMVAEVRSRKDGADRLEPMAMVGLGTGSMSCYALPGQKLTFYEIDPAVKHMVADTDKYFTYVTDARNRGAELDFRMGDARLKLKDDTDRKYTLLLVDAFSSDSIPVHLLTVEAVKLYLERVPEDGIVALHISNKFVKLEPVVAKICAELGLACRVWNDDGERRPGKTASSWVVVARNEKALGNLVSPYGDLVAKYGARTSLGMIAEKIHQVQLAPEDTAKPNAGQLLADKLEKEKGSDPVVRPLARLLRKHDPYSTSLGEAMQAEVGHVFRPLEVLDQVPAWTDDYSDVLRVMMIKEVQKLRKMFGLPTPIIDD